MGKNILVYGAGAVGRYLGGYLANGGNQVTMVTRSGASHIAEKGVTILREGKNDLHTKPHIAQTFRQGIDIAKQGGFQYDYIVMAMKSSPNSELVASCIIKCVSLWVAYVVSAMVNGRRKIYLMC